MKIFDGFSSSVLIEAANNGRSTDNVWLKLHIARTNPWIVGHVVRSFTDLLRGILIFKLGYFSTDIICSDQRTLGWAIHWVVMSEVWQKKNFNLFSCQHYPKLCHHGLEHFVDQKMQKLLLIIIIIKNTSKRVAQNIPI